MSTELTEAKVAETYIGCYDAVAVDLLSSSEPVPFGQGVMSPANMAEKVCQILKVEDFDLFGQWDWDGVYRAGDAPTVLAHGFIAFLRKAVFLKADEKGIGFPEVNWEVSSNAEFWSLKLMDRWRAIRAGAEPNHDAWQH